MMAYNFKVVLVGDAGCGKTAWINRHKTGAFEEKYIATQGVDVTPLTFNTNYGEVTFKVWDCAGQEKFGGLSDNYYVGADAAIYMFDLTNRETLHNIFKWTFAVERVVPNIQGVVCGNKCDIKEFDFITYRVGGYDWYRISAKSTHNFEKPFLDLARKLTKHSDLEFVDIEPPQVKPDRHKQINMVKIPGGMMRVTYEFIEDGEI